LGRDTSGAPVVMDLTRAPHLLIAGATGSGKSVSINAIITSLLMHHGPETLRFIMVDPKMVELPGYNGIPHLIGKVITDVEQVSGALTWLLLQMDDRYQLFRETGVRNIAAYNTKARKKKDMDLLPYLVLVVDELADLMMTAPEEIERQLVRLAQMARAVGIHLVLATQRPSTDVVTGLIKANFPTRIAFAVTSLVDSRVILDKPGAERLLGQGDMLLLRPDSAKLQRVQGCWVSDQEIERVVRFWKERDAEENPDGPVAKVAPWIGLMDRLDDEEELIQEAIDAIRGQETCSTSFVQRKLRIGYPRAARLMQELEAKGIVGPDLGGGQGRRVLLQEETEDEDENGDLFGE
ncbi:MAG: DNA translocase FtsK, partial [Caldilineae bacterium]